LKLHAETQQIIRDVEAKTGYPVHVVADEKLGTLASVAIARGPLAMHVIRYNPSADATLDYLIAFQCGFVLRLFENPAEHRFSLGSAEIGREEMVKLLNAPGGTVKVYGLKPAHVATLRDQLYDGLMAQLSSIPIGLRVDLWLLNHYPELKEQQHASVLTQMKQNSDVLRPEIERMFPQKIFRANIAMNIAYAQFWTNMTGEPNYVKAYRNHRFYSDGLALLAAFSAAPSDALNDRHLIDTWAMQLIQRRRYHTHPSACRPPHIATPPRNTHRISSLK